VPKSCPKPFPGEFYGTKHSNNGRISERGDDTLEPIWPTDGICICGDDDVTICGLKTRLSCARHAWIFQAYHTRTERSRYLLRAISGCRINNDYLEITELLLPQGG